MDAVLFIPLGGTAAWLTARLGRMFPQQTIVEYSDVILGPWLGKLASLILIGWALHTGSVAFFEVGDFIKSSILQETPLFVILILINVAPAYVVYHGIEVLGRTSDFLFPLTTGFTVLIFILLIPDFEPTKLLPLFGDGIGNVLRPLKTVVGFSGEVIVFLFFFPYIKDKQKAVKALVGAEVAIVAVGILSEAAYTMVFGLERSELNLPFYHMARYVSVGRFFERMDPFFMGANLLANFIKESILLYVVVLGLAQLFKLKNYRPLIIPVSLMINLIGVYGFKNSPQLLDFIDNVWPLYTLPLEFGLPLLLIIVARWRGLGGGTQK